MRSGETCRDAIGKAKWIQSLTAENNGYIIR